MDYKTAPELLTLPFQKNIRVKGYRNKVGQFVDISADGVGNPKIVDTHASCKSHQTFILADCFHPPKLYKEFFQECILLVVSQILPPLALLIMSEGRYPIIAQGYVNV